MHAPGYQADRPALNPGPVVNTAPRGLSPGARGRLWLRGCGCGARHAVRCRFTAGGAKAARQKAAGKPVSPWALNIIVILASASFRCSGNANEAQG